jgi:hypothetical protein
MICFLWFDFCLDVSVYFVSMVLILLASMFNLSVDFVSFGFDFVLDVSVLL